MTALEDALDRARGGDGGLYLLRGVAGIGKSRTAREIARAARDRGFGVRVGHWQDVDATPAYAAWAGALRDTNAARFLSPSQRPDPEEDGTGNGAADLEADRDELFWQVEAAVRETCVERPQLLILEDVHWADLDSIRLLQHLERTLMGAPWMALCTQRDDEPLETARAAVLADLARQAAVIPLGPLDESEVEKFVQHWTGEVSNAEIVQTARRRSGGNPLFLGELIAHSLSQTGRVSVADLESSDVPEVVQQLLDRRIGSAGALVEDLLTRAAMLGDPFDLDELSTWLGEKPEDLLTRLASAERLRLIEPRADLPNRFRFTHALVRDALLARLPRDLRAARHREVAVLLEAAGRNQTGPELVRLADHYRRGISTQTARRAVECAVAAAHHARRQGAPEQALRHLRHALDSLPGSLAATEQRDRERAELLLALGEVLSQLGRRNEACAAFGEAAQIARDLHLPEALARAAIGTIGRDEDMRGTSNEARRLVDLAQQTLGPVRTPLRAGLLAIASRLAVHAGRIGEGEALARESLEIAEETRRMDTWASSAHALHRAMVGPGVLHDRLALSREMVDAAHRGSSRRTELLARQQHLADLLQVGDVAAAEEERIRIDALAREIDRPASHWHALSLAAGFDLFRGRLEAGEERMKAAFEQGRRAGLRSASPLFAIQMFHLRELQGRLGELRPAMQEMIERNPQVPSLPLIVLLAAMQEDDELLVRTSFEPLAARRFEDIPHDDDWLPTLATHARIAAYLRDTDRCALLLEILRPYAHWCIALPDGQFWRGSVAGVLAPLEAVLGRFDEARRSFSVALEAVRQAGALPLVAQTLLEFGRFEAERDPAGRTAREAFEESLALFTRMETPLFVERVTRALASLPSSDGADVSRPPEMSQTAGRSQTRDPSETDAGPRGEVKAGRSQGRFERQGTQWTIDYASRRSRVAHRKGMSDLAVLLASPHREFHVLDLIGMADGTVRSLPGAGNSTSIGRGPRSLSGADPDALAQYRDRLSELRLDLDEARDQNDLARERSITSEIDWLERELQNAFGEGRSQRDEFSEKARKAIYNRIRTAVDIVASAHPDLGRHLRNSIRTGVVCAYHPEAVCEWTVLDSGDG